MRNESGTIAAISTAMSNSGIGIVRMSGEEAVEIAERIYKGKNEKKLSKQPTHTIHYGYIVDGEDTIDEVLVMLMRGPHSYTGEDTVEINCHGGVYVVRRILETVIKYGARPADPGEFTKRAFLNGKMDLSQAEAVGDLISSKNEYALRSSVSQLKGNIKKEIQKIREEILYHTAFIETALDDPEHISVDGYGEKLEVVVEDHMKSLKHLLSTCDDGRMIKEGIKTVIVGKPNAGKSSLLNVLLGEERAIVTEIAGTTRDVLEEHMNLQGISLNIVDTAGIRDTEDVVEKIGVERAKKYLKDADLVIYVVDTSTALDENDAEIMELLRDRHAIILLNKSDLEQITTVEDVRKHLDKTMIPISAKEQTGIDALEKEIKEMPNYFSDYNTTVHFITEEELEKNHSGMAHGGFVIRSGKTGMNKEHNHIIEYSLKLDSNPEFTTSVLIAYARAAKRLYDEGQKGCKTVLDIAPAYLSEMSDEDLRAHLL